MDRRTRMLENAVEISVTLSVSSDGRTKKHGCNAAKYTLDFQKSVATVRATCADQGGNISETESRPLAYHGVNTMRRKTARCLIDGIQKIFIPLS
jgi:hypothetical protein